MQFPGPLIEANWGDWIEVKVTNDIPDEEGELKSNGTHLLWYMANRTMRIDYNSPTLLEAKLSNLNFPYSESVHNYGTNASVRFIVENTSSLPHPMHLHGHNMFLLAERSCSSASPALSSISSGGGGNSIKALRTRQTTGSSTPYSCWDGAITNAAKPQLRDVQMLLPGNFIVVQCKQDNTGSWPFHCHIVWHASVGFLWNVLEQPRAVQSEAQIPAVMAQTCRDWAAWTGGHVVDEIDSGL